MVFKRRSESPDELLGALDAAIPESVVDEGESMGIEPALSYEPAQSLSQTPNFLYRALEPVWAEANQTVRIDYDLAAAFAVELGSRDAYVGRGAQQQEFAERLADRTSNEPDRIRRLKKIIHDAIAGPPNHSERGLLDQVVRTQLGRDVRLYPTYQLVDRLFSLAYGWGPLQPFMNNDRVTEIMVVGYDRIFTEQTFPGEGARMVEMRETFESPDVLERFAKRMAEGTNKELSRSNPTLDLSLPSGERVNVTVFPVTDQPVITIRRFKEQAYTLDDLLRYDSFSDGMFNFLIEANLAGLNFITYGETGSGKTTLLTALINEKPVDKRIVVVEDTREIYIDNAHRNKVRMLTADGVRNMRDLVRNALRQRPDHLIVGETRDATAFDLIQAFNTGTRGSMSTLHANNPKSALRRLTTLLRMADNPPEEVPARHMVSDAIHLLIHAGRLADGNRAIVSIDEVLPLNERGEFETRNIFRLVPTYENGRTIKQWVHNPAWEMSEALRDMFAAVGLDASRWDGYDIQERRDAVLQAQEEAELDDEFEMQPLDAGGRA